MFVMVVMMKVLICRELLRILVGLRWVGLVRIMGV